MIAEIKTAYKYAVAQWKDVNPYYNVYEGWGMSEKPDYTNIERTLVLLMHLCTDFAAAVTVAWLMQISRVTYPNEEDCVSVADVWHCKTDEMHVALEWVLDIMFTLILANIFSTVLGGSLLQKGFHIDCCCQPMLYVWLVIILVFALLLIIAYFDFSEECKFGCYKCLLDTCDIYFPPTEKYIGDGCHSIYQGGGVQIAIAWGYAQVNSLFIVIPKNTVLVYFRMKVDCIPFIGIDPYEEYEAPEPTWLKKCCER